MYTARYRDKRGSFLLGSLFWEKVSHPTAQRLFLILLAFFFLKQHLSFSAGTCPLVPAYKPVWELCFCTSAFCLSHCLRRPSKTWAAVPGYPQDCFGASFWCPSDALYWQVLASHAPCALLEESSSRVWGRGEALSQPAAEPAPPVCPGAAP